MADLDKHTIKSSGTIIDALVKLNQVHSQSMTLFVVSDDNVMLGTLTDGDIRRALIKGFGVNESVVTAMNRNFAYLTNSEDILEFKKLREKGILLVPLLDHKGKLVSVFDLSNKTTVLPVDAVLMAGGKGERLRPLTEKTPKPLLKVGDKCIIDHNIDRLIRYGIKHINVTVNYLHEQLEEHFAEPRMGVQVQTVSEPKFMGTIGSIQFVEKFYNDTVLLMNSDLFTNIDYEDFFLHFKTHNADMSVAAIPYTVSIPYGIFDLDGRLVKGILEKPTYNYYANSGIYLIKRDLLNLIPKDTNFNATDFLELLASKGYKVIRFPLNGTWIDIGNPQEYQKAQELAKHLN